MGAERLAARFSTWLLRPYLDLGPLHVGPLHAQAVKSCWQAFANPSVTPFWPQRAMAPAFRTQLAGEAGAAWDIGDPRDLPDDLRTAHWTALCDALEAWDALRGEDRCRLASLLHSLCLYRPLVAIAGDVTPTGPDIELMWWRASAQYMLNLPRQTAVYHDADMTAFEHIALTGADAVPAGFNATAMVFVHKAKTGVTGSELAQWATRLEDALALATSGMDGFTAGLLSSRFHRAMGFLPQRRGDRHGVIREMETAERLARALVPMTPAQQVLYGENLHAVMESRTKEALWLGDMDAALARARCVTEIDPYDAKAWVELGEVLFRRREWRDAVRAYAVAATLGPPATAVARHMLAVCLRELGDVHVAALLWRDTLEADPLGISPRQEIADLPDAPALAALKEWSRTTVEW